MALSRNADLLSCTSKELCCYTKKCKAIISIQIFSVLFHHRTQQLCSDSKASVASYDETSILGGSSTCIVLKFSSCKQSRIMNSTELEKIDSSGPQRKRTWQLTQKKLTALPCTVTKQSSEPTARGAAHFKCSAVPPAFCPTWQRHRTGCRRSPVRTLPLPPVANPACGHGRPPLTRTALPRGPGRKLAGSRTVRRRRSVARSVTFLSLQRP